MDLAKGTLDHIASDFTDWADILNHAYWLTISLCDIHSQKCTHYDLHPGNVAFLDHLERVALLDLGMSRLVNDIQHESGVYGRLDYLPPEAFQDTQQFTQAYDVYCLGTLLWQLVTKVPPKNNAQFAISNRPDR